MLTGFCSLVSVMIAIPKDNNSQSFAQGILLSITLLLFFLVPAVTGALLTRRFTHFRFWGVSFAVFWMIPFLVLLLLVILVFSRTR